jgi:hypothetical protein
VSDAPANPQGPDARTPGLAGRAARRVRAAVAGLAGQSCPEDAYDGRFLFITGCARSGTNWLGALINLHPHAVSHGEFKLQWVADGVERAARNPWNVGHRVPRAGAIMREHLDDLVRRAMVAGIPPRPETRLIADHSPVYFRPMLSPDRARHAIIVRDGRDVLVSWTYHVLRHRRTNFILRPLRAMFEQALATLDGSDGAIRAAAARLLLSPEWAWRYADDWSRRVLDDRQRLAELDPAIRAATTLIRYEDLHADIEARRADLYRLCGLDPALAAPVSRETNTAPGHAAERPGKMLRKGQAGDWRNYFTRPVAEAFHAWAGTALAEHGYESGAHWVHECPDRLEPAISGT